jgi:hypothetical protein
MKDDNKTNEKSFYVHFLNYEKRMDRWITEKQVRKNLGNKDKDLDLVTNFFIISNFFILVIKI